MSIVAEYGNSVNVTERSMKYAGTLLGFQDYLQGQRLYLNLCPVEACENADQVRGWNDAAHYEAERDLDYDLGTDPR